MKAILNIGKAFGLLFGGGVLFLGACIYITIAGFDCHKSNEKYQQRKIRKAQKQRILKSNKSGKEQVIIGAHS